MKKLTLGLLALTLVLLAKPTLAQESQGRSLGDSALNLPANALVWKFGGWGSLNIGDTLTFNDARFTSSGETIDSARLIYEGRPSVTLGLEVALLPREGWGFNSGFSFDSRRRLHSAKFSSIGGGAFVRGEDPEIDIRVFYGNLVYRAQNFYIPFGINLSSVTLTSPTLALNGVKGGLGGQFGFGYFFSERFAFELLFRSVGIHGEAQTTGGATLDLRRGILQTAMLQGKGYF